MEIKILNEEAVERMARDIFFHLSRLTGGPTDPPLTCYQVSGIIREALEEAALTGESIPIHDRSVLALRGEISPADAETLRRQIMLQMGRRVLVVTLGDEETLETVLPEQAKALGLEPLFRQS